MTPEARPMFCTGLRTAAGLCLLMLAALSSCRQALTEATSEDADAGTGTPSTTDGGSGVTPVGVGGGGGAGTPVGGASGGASGEPAQPGTDAAAAPSVDARPAATTDAAGPLVDAAAPRQDLATGLIASWPFSEATGSTTTAAVPAGRVGQLQNGTQWTEGAPGASAPSVALSFDGVDDVVELRDPNVTVSQSYTYAAWVKPSTVSAVSVFLRTRDDGPLARWGEQLRITAAGQFEHHNTNVRNVTGSTVVTAGQWYHVAISATVGAPMHLFVNGKEEGTPVVTPAIEDCDRVLVGSRSGNAMGFFGGVVDELAAWNRELTSAQIQALAAGQRPGTSGSSP